jgi:hypothetical protein
VREETKHVLIIKRNLRDDHSIIQCPSSKYNDILVNYLDRINNKVFGKKAKNTILLRKEARL